MKTVSSMWQRTRRSIAELASDCRGLAATEFAFIVPLMLVMFFGTVEFSSGVAVDRKVSLMARTLADVRSQNTSVTDTQLQNFFNASAAIMWPYVSTPPPTPNPVNSTSASSISTLPQASRASNGARELYLDRLVLPLPCRQV